VKRLARLTSVAAPIAGLGVGMLAVGSMLAFPTHDATLLTALVCVMAYSVLAPALALLGRSFWLAGSLALVSWFVMLVGLMAMSEAVSKRPLGEDAMVLLLPFMTFPTLLGVAGLVRLFFWLQDRARARAEQAAGRGRPTPRS
jgi:hypothetical protein